MRQGMSEQSAGSEPAMSDTVSQPSELPELAPETVIELDDSRDTDYRARHGADPQLRSASFDGSTAVTRHVALPATPRGRVLGAASAIGRAAVSGGQITRRALRLPAGRLALTGALLAALIAGTAAAGAAVVPELAEPASSPTTAPVPSTAPSHSPSFSPRPQASGSPSDEPAIRPADQFASWATQISPKVEIPVVALQAYAYAEWVMSKTRQSCKLQWTTLAAIGKVESDHGRGGGSVLDQQGHSKPNILGPALNGTGGTQKINDTDAGALDGDKTWDHAIGSMQFLPGTWRSYAVDADGDQLADPFDLDDAALAAAYYLCASGKDLTVVADWKAVVLTYNNVGVYLEKVFEVAQGYGTRSRA